jgi:hypothetical protein
MRELLEDLIALLCLIGSGYGLFLLAYGFGG